MGQVNIKVKLQVSGWVCDEFNMTGTWEEVKEGFTMFLASREKNIELAENVTKEE